MNLQEKVCVITGAAKGLGRQLAEECQKRGARVVIGDLSGDELDATIHQLDICGTDCDVTEEKEVASLAQKALDQYGHIDVWINNAGIWMPYTPAVELDFARARALMEVNFFGLAHGTIEALKHLTNNEGGGAIVNMVSVRGLEGKSLAAGYSASKFAAEGFTQAVRSEYADRNIDVIGIYPYRMKTELFGDNKHSDYGTSMEPAEVAKIVIDNLTDTKPSQHLEIWSTSDIRKK